MPQEGKYRVKKYTTEAPVEQAQEDKPFKLSPEEVKALQDQGSVVPKSLQEGPPAQDKPKEAEALGFLTNLPKSTFDMAKSVLVDLPVTAVNQALNIVKNPEQYSKDVQLLFRSPGSVLSVLKDGVTDYYTKDFWYNLNDDPARFLSDLATIASGGAAVAGKLGRVARVTEGLRPIAKPAIGAARAMRTVGRYADPLVATGKLASKVVPKIPGVSRVVKSLGDSLGYGPYSKDLTQLDAALTNAAQSDLNRSLQKVLFGELKSEEDRARLLKAMAWGDADDVAKLRLERPDLAKRLELWRERVEGFEEPALKGEGQLTDKAGLRAKITGMKWYAKKFLNLDLSTKEAATRIRSGKNSPVFFTMFRKDGGPKDLFSLFNTEYYRGGALGRSERRAGTLEYLTDPDVIMARQMAAFHDFKYKLGLLRSTKQMLAEKGALRVVKTPADAAKALEEGFAPLQNAYYEKYWKDAAEATEVIGNALRKGGNPIRNLEEAKDVYSRLKVNDKELIHKGDLYVPKHVASWLNRRLAPISTFERISDATMGKLKSAFTVFNPRFWGGVIFGNALLAMYAGVSPGRVGRLTADLLPDELKHLARHEAFLKDVGAYTRIATRFGEFAQKLDNIFKTGVYANEIAKNSLPEMKAAGQNFFAAFQASNDALRFYATKPREYAEILAQMRKVREEIGQKLSNIAGLRKQEGRLGQKFSKAAAREGVVKKAGPGDPVYTPQGQAPVDPYGYEPTSTKVSPPEGPQWQQFTNEPVVKPGEVYPDAPYVSKPKASRDRLIARSQEYESKSNEILQAEAEVMAKMVELGALEQKVPALRQFAAVTERAIEAANRFFPSFDRLAPFEKRVVRQLVPFWTFTKGITKLAAQLPYLHPKRFFLYHALQQAWEDIMEDNNSFTPQWLKAYTPVGTFVDEKGEPKVVAIRSGSLSPLNNVRMSQLGEIGIPGVLDFVRQNPIISLGMDLAGSIPKWSARPLSPGVNATRLDNGEVWEWTGKGWKKTIAQPNLFRSLYYLFPQAQIVDAMFQPYVQSDRGWLLDPDPKLGPDGKPMIMRSLYERLSGILIPSTSYNLEQLRRRERGYINQITRSYINEYQKASPVKRQNILTVLNAWRERQIRPYLER